MDEVTRQEKKYLINMEDYYKYSHYLSRFMMEDIHNGSQGYMIRSLYFDTMDNRDFYEKIYGVEPRRKIRLRYYGSPNKFVMLEMKQKQGIRQLKRSLKMDIDHADQLTKGNYSPLLNYSNPFALECYGLLNTHMYRPKAIVQYNRRAFIAKENRIRITFDHNITATESSFDIFSDNLCLYPVFDKFNAVLEIKYNGFLLTYIRNLINGINASEIAVSKYCLGRNIGLKYII